MFKTLSHLVLIAATSTSLVVPLMASSVKAASVTLFTGGASNPNAGQGFNNGDNTSSTGFVYENFTVPTTNDWIVDTVFSNNQMNFTSNLATWEIRTGVSTGNGGTLVAGGQNVAAQVPTGITIGGNPEYTITVSVSNIVLTPGSYWLAVAPVDSGLGQSFISYGSGTNNSFFTNNSLGITTPQPISDFSTATNFSVGIKGNVAPVPFELSPTLGIIILGVWATIAKLRLNR